MPTAELSRKYMSRFGIIEENCDFIKFIEIIERITLVHKGFFIFKIDGERLENIYTFIVNFSQNKNFILRKDTDSLQIGMEYIFSELERANIYL